MRLIVTGASGFLGRNLVLALPETWEVVALYNRSEQFPAFVSSLRRPRVKAVQCDLTREQDVERVQRDQGSEFDGCIYLAANGDPARSVSEPVMDLRSNVVGLINFLSGVRVRRLVYLSSGAVYDGLKGPVSPKSNLNPTLPYAIGKWAAEQYIKHFALTSRVSEYLTVRFFGAYGPYEPSRKIYTRLVQAFAVRKERSFTVRGDGRNLIDAMFVEDAITALLKMLLSPVRNLTVDLCSGHAMSIDQLVQAAGSTFGVRDLQITHEGSVAEYIRFYASIDPARECFGVAPKTSLEDGLRRLHQFTARP